VQDKYARLTSASYE